MGPGVYPALYESPLCFAAVFLLIGMSIYTSETANKVINSSYNYQWSFYLCWTAEALLIVAGWSVVPPA